MWVSFLNLERGHGVPLLKFDGWGSPGVPFLNLRKALTFKL